MSQTTERGAPMGRPSTPADTARPVIRVCLQRVRLNRGGYDSSGAYWGHGLPLFSAMQEDGPWNGTFRAADRDAAKAMIRAFFGSHDVRFIR